LIVVGVDGGATKTRALAVDTSSLRACGCLVEEPSNPNNVGVAAAASAVEKAVRCALQGLGAPAPDTVYCGLAGLDSERLRLIIGGKMAELLSSVLGGRVIVDHDAYIALMACTLGAPGILVIAGTGSIVYGVDEEGSRRIAGDRGWLLGDEASSYAVGLDALQALRRSLDGLEPRSCLTEGLSMALGLDSIDKLMEWFHRLGLGDHVSTVAAVAATVCRLAEEGCGEAAEILRWRAMLHARDTVWMAEKMNYTGPVYIAGGLWGCRPYREEYERLIAAYGLEAVPAPRPPVLGAAMLALREAGHPDPWSLAENQQILGEAWKLY